MEKINLESAKLPICDHCLGRIYALLGHGLSNQERGHAIRIMFAMENNLNVETLTPENCEICNNTFSRLDDYAHHIAQILKGYEYDTFMIGSRFPRETMAKDEEYRAKFGDLGEPINRELNRELGKIVMSLTGKEATIKNPDITVIVDTEYDDFRLEIKPLLIYGRYKKLVRGIPQTKWPSGKYSESVEEIISRPIMKITGGTGHALHGMGREDIDARMLGNGRPFIVEIKAPRRRKIEFQKIQDEINSSGKVEVTDLRYATRDEIQKIKSAEPRKRYRVGITADVNEDEIKSALASLVGKISQRTPTRVKHRRADRVRIREVYEIKLLGKKEDAWVVEVLAQSGTYIKELMHGDSGRTTPSLAEKLGKKVEVLWLDVIEILD